MTTMTRLKAVKKAEVVKQLSALTLAGEIITWNAGDQTHTHGQTVQALKDASLSENVARELLPRHAFSRACKTLADERIIDSVKEDNDLIHFQFTKRALVAEEMQYSKETVMTLNKTTGKVACEIIALESMAQQELDRCMEARTSSDITRMVQKLFELEADLFAIRDQGGAYFVPAVHAAFVDKIEQFLVGLGGKVSRFPVPAGTATGDRAVKTTVAEGINKIVKDYETAVQEFGTDTRESTIKAKADQIKVIRHKIEAYALMLADRKVEVEKALAEANRKLVERVQQIGKAKAEIESAGDNAGEVNCDHCGGLNVVKNGQKGCKCKHCHKEFALEWE